MDKSENLPLNALARVESAARELTAALAALHGNSTPGIVAVASPSDCIGLTAAANEFLLAKARAQRSDGYLGLALKHLRAFTDGRERRPLASITAAEVETWLYDNKWSCKTRHGHLLTVRTFLNFCVARSYITKNPALAVDLPILTPAEKGVHHPEQVKAVLESCGDANTLRFLAIRYFAGLRGSEASALSEDEIRAEFILVSSEKAKTRQRRLVTIQPNLRAWLDETKSRGGSLPLRQASNRFAKAVADSGVPWPDNVTRHSFCSYHLSAFGNAGKTALEAGHSEDMLFKNYRELTTLGGELITPALAKEFWSVFP